MKRVIGLALLVLLLAGAWLFRGRITDAWQTWRGGDEEAVPTEALAVRAEEKIDGLREGRHSRTSLSAVELESLLMFRYPAVIPSFMGEPDIEIDDDLLRLRARVPVDKLPSVGELGEAAGFLPDTTDITVEGKLLPLEGGRVAFGVDQVSAAGFPLPSRLVPGALRRLGRTDEPGLPRDAMALPLPSGIGAAYLRGDSLVLLNRASAASAAPARPRSDEPAG